MLEQAIQHVLGPLCVPELICAPPEDLAGGGLDKATPAASSDAVHFHPFQSRDFEEPIRKTDVRLVQSSGDRLFAY